MISIMNDLWRIEVPLEPKPLVLFPVEIIDEDHNKDWR
jgi:hypothetical protein